jgi:peptidoglycan/LPS O-acetylase OafA/YrhL
MNSEKKPMGRRLLFFDCVRYSTILGVVLLHASLSYCRLVPWWPVLDIDPKAVSFFDVVVLILDVFVMPVMYFVAGFFALSSLRRRGIWGFIKGKLQRLGIPLAVGSSMVAPVIGYIYYYSRSDGLVSMGYLNFWMMYLKSFGDFHVGYISSFHQFSQNLYWFLSLLLFFFIALALFYECKMRWFGGDAPRENEVAPSDRLAFPALILVGFLCAGSLMLMHLVIVEEPWFIFANVIQFQPTRVFLYVFYFALGVWGFSRGWFLNGDSLGSLKCWVPACLLLSVGFLAAVKALLTSLSPSLWLLAAYCLARSFFCLSILVVLTSFTFHYRNRPSRIDQILSASSYNTYLLHLVIVLALNFALVSWTGGSAYLKFAVVSILSITLSLGISQFLLKPVVRL